MWQFCWTADTSLGHNWCVSCSIPELPVTVTVVKFYLPHTLILLTFAKKYFWKKYNWICFLVIIELYPYVIMGYVGCSVFHRSRVSSGSIVFDYGLDDPTIGVRSPAGAEDFSSSLCVQTGSGAHPASCTMGTGGPFPGGKARPGRDADHSPPSSAEVENE
jgi:hypothetical protein